MIRCSETVSELKIDLQAWLVDPQTIIFPETTAHDVFKTLQNLLGQAPRQRCRPLEVVQKHAFWAFFGWEIKAGYLTRHMQG